MEDKNLDANQQVEQQMQPEDNEKNKKATKKKGADVKLIQENEQLKAQLEESLKKAEEYKQSWYRSAADFENFKRRNSESRAIAYSDGKSDVIKSILPIGDNLDRALLSVQDDKTKAGIELVIKQFSEVIKNLGVEEINPVGEVFDPNLHEAIFQAEPEEGDQSGTIKSVFRKGYQLNGKMIRYAQVVVIK